MIVTLSMQLEHQVKDYQLLKGSEGRITKILQTRDALNSLSDGIGRWVEVYPAVAPYLSEPLKVSLQTMARDILRHVVETRTKVEKDYTSAEALNALLGNVGDLLDQTSIGWTAYAQRPVAALESRARLARDLPRMQGNISDIEQRITSIKRLAEQLPRRADEINIYHRNIAYLDERLRDLEGLNEEQKAFLALIHENRATLADVSDSLLDWCRRERLAQSLQVRFKDTR